MSDVDIEIIQFLRPDGRQQMVKTAIPSELKPKYDAIRDAGLRMTAEVLSTGKVSIWIEDPGRGDFQGAIVNNGPEVPGAIQDLLSGFNAEALAAWREAFDKSGDEARD